MIIIIKIYFLNDLSNENKRALMLPQSVCKSEA